MRGEYRRKAWKKPNGMELPPRARRILATISGLGWNAGTTSACAENTLHQHSRGAHQRNYLCVRGEYAWDAVAAGINWELPPRARRIPAREVMAAATEGTTSACAENTGVAASLIPNLRNYLRVRGEYHAIGDFPGADQELPPRARRILVISGVSAKPDGTTSACAENTTTDGPHG